MKVLEAKVVMIESGDDEVALGSAGRGGGLCERCGAADMCRYRRNLRGCEGAFGYGDRWRLFVTTCPWYTEG